MPSEKRSLYPLCGARRRSGEACRAFAGQGTDHLGVGRCKFHGGCTPSHRAHAVKVEARQRSAEFGQMIDVEPTEALLSVLHLSAGHLAWAREELGLVEDRMSHEFQVLARMFDDERDRVARIAKACLDAGVAERQVVLAERYGEQLAVLLRGLFDDPELSLSTRQQARLPSVLRRHLAVVEATPLALDG